MACASIVLEFVNHDTNGLPIGEELEGIIERGAQTHVGTALALGLTDLDTPIELEKAADYGGLGGRTR